MEELKQLSEEQKDLIKAKVGGSKLYLKAISSNRVFRGLVSKLTLEFGDKFSMEVENIVACYLSSIKKGNRGFTYSRDKQTYTSFNKTIENRRPSSYKRTIEVLGLLEASGYIELYKGYKDIAADSSMSACCVFEEKLIQLVDSKLIMKFAKVLTDDSVEVRNEKGEPIKGIDGTTSITKVVDSINTWLNRHDFYFGVFPQKIYLQRVYNLDLNTSGRFYFGASQTIQSMKRRSFLIDGKAVCELDYSSQHFAILACLSGHILPEDFKPYDIDVSDLLTMKDGYCPVKARKIVKLACLLLINSGNATASMKNVWTDNWMTINKLMKEGKYKQASENPFFGLSGKDNCSKLISRLKEHNSYAKEYFKRKGGMWGLCQNLDSEIMLNVILRLKKLDKPLLPYHDSAVVKVEDCEALRTAMRESWNDVLGTYNNCRIDRKF